jgi:hypothetical protein
MQASYFSVNSSNFKTEKTQKTYRENEKQPPTSSGGMKESDQEIAWNRQRQHQPQLSSKPINHDKNADQYYYEMMKQHLLYGVVGKISLTCRQQKIQMDSGDVYVVQDLYGMSTGNQNNDTAATTTTSEHLCVHLIISRSILHAACVLLMMRYVMNLCLLRMHSIYVADFD